MKVVTLFNNETKLIKKAIQHNRKAQHTLYEMHAPKMLSVCRYYIKDLQKAEEVMLNGFLKVFTNLKQFKSEGSFEGWIRRIMVNECISQLRKEKRLHFQDSEILENSTAHVSYMETELEVEAIQKLIDSLPDGYRTVFVLYAVEGYKHGEIAEMLQISENTSKSQLHKARKELQEKLNLLKNTQYGTR